MYIRAKLHLLTIISVSIILLVTGTLVVTTVQTGQAARENEIASTVNRHLIELCLLTTDYVLHGGIRAEQQWHTKQDQLAKLIAIANFTEAADQTIAAQIERNLAGMHVLFVGLNKLSHAPPANTASASELQRHYVDQLSTRAQTIASDAVRLEQSSSERDRLIRHRRVWIFVCAVVLVAGYMIGIAIAFNRGIVQPLNRLHKGTEIIGSGRLDYKVGMAVQDEIGQLSRAFDTMTDRLQKITVSRDELAAEIKRRNMVEADLARSNNELKTFAYVASHDLQEPLRAVAGFVELLRQRYAGKLDDKADQYITFAVDGAKRMQTLINDLLEYSRVSTRGGAFTIVDCNAVLAEALANLSVAIQESQAVITHDPLPKVHCDAAQIVRLLQNLIGNAIKFRSQAPPRLHIGAEQRATEWQFSVRDNGIGIDEQFFDRIFVIFQRLHTQKHYTGTGLGLAICKRIVERHGGRIWVESVPAHGSTFFFTLPAFARGGSPP